jgi:hypothetical protein
VTSETDGPATWWGAKTRQFAHHLRARVTGDERAVLAGWVTPAAMGVFDGMHVADRRHGLDVVATLRAQGIEEPDVLVAGLLHDAGKRQTGVSARIAYSLGQRYGRWIWRVAGVLPGWSAALRTLHDHAEASARLAAAAGCSDLTVELIRHQDAPLDPGFGELLRLADEAN